MFAFITECFIQQETPSLLQKNIEFAQAHGISFGAKLVRGAYIYKERALAAEKGYPDPVCETFEKTTENYNRSMDILMTKMVKYPGKFCTTIASHNEETIRRGTKKWVVGLRDHSLTYHLITIIVCCSYNLSFS